MGTIGMDTCLSWGVIGLLLAVFGSACDPSASAPFVPRPDAPVSPWSAYGGDEGGQRHSPLSEITRDNVNRLAVAWEYHTGDLSDGTGDIPSTSAFQATPIMVDQTLYFCTPFNRVIALDPETGQERWTYDPRTDLSGQYANQLVCRGVSSWLDADRPAGSACRRRIFTATNDARLIALDATTGAPCADFGDQGIVDLNPGVGDILWRGEYQVTSPPAVVHDLVIVGSAVADNVRVNPPSGVVRAWDARTGALRWSWDLAPPDFVPSPDNTGSAGYALGTPNVWAPMSVDTRRDLVFVPTGNPSPDYFRGGSNLDYYGSAVVALRASTGQVVWHYQTVHRDLWDFDVPAQPALISLRRGGQAVPALVQATKMGFVFVLHRETGQPLFEIEERPVPQGRVPGERLSPTQPFPLKPPPLVGLDLRPEQAWGLTRLDRVVCRDKLKALRWEGMYTPPSREGTLMYPGNAGGSNWGSVAFDPERQLLIANTEDVPWMVRLFAAEDYERERAARPGVEIAPQRGTPYGLHREVLLSPLGLLCNPPPWGSLAAVDLVSGELRWQEPLGIARLGPLVLEGLPNAGGPLVTGSGLVFIGATFDNSLRAFDLETGEEVWQADLPAGGQATPMTYRARTGGKQYIVIAAGGYGRVDLPGNLGDALVAFALE